MANTNFGTFLILLLTSRRMFLETIMTLVQQMSGTPYSHGYSSAGTDCSGLASLVSNVAADRPAFSGRFNTGNEESALLARGFKYGTAANAVVIGWNGGHTAVTLPDGTPVSSGEGGGGGRTGGGGAYQAQFSHHMSLPIDGEAPADAPAPVLVSVIAPDAPPPPPAPDAPPPPAPDAPPPPAPGAPPPPAPDAPPADGPQDAPPPPA